MNEQAENVAGALSPDMAITRKPNVPWKELDGVAVILNLETGEYFELDEVGLCLWKRLEAEATVAELAAHLAHSYDVVADAAIGDVIEFCQELQTRALI